MEEEFAPKLTLWFHPFRISCREDSQDKRPSVNVRVIPRGPTWRRHLDQLRPRYGSDQDDDPCEIPTSVLSTETLPAGTDHASSSSSMNQRNNPRLPTGDEYGRHNLRRSARTKRPPKKYCC